MDSDSDDDWNPKAKKSKAAKEPPPVKAETPGQKVHRHFGSSLSSNVNIDREAAIAQLCMFVFREDFEKS